MNTKGGLLILLLSMSAACLQAQTTLSLFGQKDYIPELNDIWGYADQNGNEFALVGLQTGVSIVDLSVSTLPELHFIPGIQSVWRDLKTYGTHAYVTNESGNGLLIIDLSGLPGSVSYKDTIIDGITTAHNLYIEGDQMYLTGTNNNGGGIVRFDLGADPWNPVFVSSYTERYVHDVYVRHDTAYSAEISDGFLTVIDYTDPLFPQVLSSTPYLNSFTHNTWLNDSGNVVFTTDELAEAYIYSWDLSDPSNPRILDGIRSSLSSGGAIPHNVHVQNDYLITSYYRDGLHVTDASRPHNLVEVGLYDTSPLEDDGFNGAWGAYPFLPSGRILVSDIENGLFVLTPAYQRGCYLEGVVRDAVTSLPIPGITVKILGEFIEDISLPDGRYATGIGVPGTYEVEFSQYGYITDTLLVSLSNGHVTTADLNLVPVGRVPLRISVKDAQTLSPLPGVSIQLIAPEGAATFDLTTISTGMSEDSYFVINEYEFIVAKWGYTYSAARMMVDSTSYQFEFFLEKGYEDNFALDLGWKVFGNAERGIWERGAPQGTYRVSGDIYNPDADLPFDIGNKAYVTGNSGGLPFGDDVDNGFTMLVSPPMDLRSYNEPAIDYFWWFLNWSLNDGGRPANDFLSVSITDGTDTFEIKRYDGAFDTIWNAETQFYFLKYFPDLNRDLQIIFYTQDFEPGNQDAVEAAIDGFRVKETALTSLPDLINNGRIRILPISDTKASFQWNDLPQGLSLELSDLAGRQISNLPIPSESGAMPVCAPVPGIYLLKLHRNGETVAVRKWNTLH